MDPRCAKCVDSEGVRHKVKRQKRSETSRDAPPPSSENCLLYIYICFEHYKICLVYLLGLEEEDNSRISLNRVRNEPYPKT